MRYFVAGLMMCHKVWTVKTAALMDLSLESLEGDISWFADEPIARIVYNIQIKSANSDADMIKIVQGGASGCPAFQTMERAARIEVSIKHNDKLIHEQVFGVK
jgi:uncharacterized OsmC-like protein